MKVLIIGFISLLNTQIYSTTDSIIKKDAAEIVDYIEQSILQDAITSKLQLRGAATITFLIDDHNQIQISQVESSDMIIAFHVKKFLQNFTINSLNYLANKSYTIAVEFKAEETTQFLQTNQNGKAAY